MARAQGTDRLIWLRVGAPLGRGSVTLSDAALQLIAQQLTRLGFDLLISSGAGRNLPHPDGATIAEDPGHSGANVQKFLDYHRPDGLLLLGSDLPHVLIEHCAEAHIPMLMAEAAFAAPSSLWPWKKLRRRADLTRLRRVLVTDQAAHDAALAQGCPLHRIEISGQVTPTYPPLSHAKAEYVAMTEALKGRPTWLAACITAEEWPIIAAAQCEALRQSHRLMLITLPADPADGPDMAAAFEDAGLIVAQRALDEDPTEEANVYLADDPEELGQWYRLCPLCFMGSTFAGPSHAARHPFEPAALGSAILNGPQTERFAAPWRQLMRAGATQSMTKPTELATHLCALLAPDRAAQLAANAWEISTGGAGVAARIAKVTQNALNITDPLIHQEPEK